MKETLLVSSRGQITLPVSVRRRLGLKGGDVVILEERDDEIVLKAGAVVPIERYTDAQIVEWDEIEGVGSTDLLGRQKFESDALAHRRLARLQQADG